MFGTFVLSLCSAFNFWQYNHFYFGKTLLYNNICSLDFIYVYGLIVILCLLTILILHCLDNKVQESETYGYKASTKVYNSDLDSSRNEVFA
jgi:hypothetical protein